MNNEYLKILKEFLEYPLDSGDRIFEKFSKIPNAIIKNKGEKLERFLYIPGKRENKVLLVAHTDTYWDKIWYEENYVDLTTSEHKIKYAEDGIFCSLTEEFGIGADDRAGCALLWLLKDLGHSILLTDGEEHGQRGSNWLIKGHKDLAENINEVHNFIIQLDLDCKDHFKCYKVGTFEFTKYIEEKTGYKHITEPGKTDIRVLCNKIPGANLSIGYYNKHNKTEELNVDDWLNTFSICRKWLAEEQLPKFKLE